MFGAGTQRLINIAIGGLVALAMLVSLILLFGTTQPHRAEENIAVLTD
jgi:hypothetical protein